MRNPDGTERIRTIIPGQVGTGKCMAPRAFVSTDPLSLAANFLFAVIHYDPQADKTGSYRLVA